MKQILRVAEEGDKGQERGITKRSEDTLGAVVTYVFIILTVVIVL